MLAAAPGNRFSKAKASNSPWRPQKLSKGENHEESTLKDKNQVQHKV